MIDAGWRSISYDLSNFMWRFEDLDDTLKETFGIMAEFSIMRKYGAVV